MHLLHRHDEGIPAEVLSEMARQIGIGRPAASRFGFWVSVVAFGCALLLLGDGLIQLSKGSLLFGQFIRRTLLCQGIWVVPLSFWISARRSRFHRIRNVMLQHLRCPHCGYDLRLLPTAPADGATTCPECGCAWNLEDSNLERACEQDVLAN